MRLQINIGHNVHPLIHAKRQENDHMIFLYKKKGGRALRLSVEKQQRVFPACNQSEDIHFHLLLRPA